MREAPSDGDRRFEPRRLPTNGLPDGTRPAPADPLQRISTLSATGFATAQQAITAILELAAELLGLETVIVSSTADALWTIAHAVDRRFGSEPGGAVPLLQSHCSLVVADVAPVVFNDTHLPVVHARFPLPNALGVHAYIGVPLLLRDGSIFGSLCAMDDRPRDFGERDVALLQVLARLVVHELEHEMRIAAVRSAGDAAIARNEARFHSLVQHTWEMIVVLDDTGIIRDASPGVTRMLGHPPDTLIGTSAFALVHPDDLPAVRGQLTQLLRYANEAVATTTFRAHHEDGSLRWLEVMGTNLLTDPAVGGVVINARDVTERRALEAQLAHDASHDPLTGLPNRALFLERLAAALAPERAADGLSAVLFLDLDRFKLINDSLGHAAGDALLITIGRELRAALQPSDLIARFGGDEMAVLLAAPVSSKQAAFLAEQLVLTLQRPFVVAGREVFTSLSIGVALGSAGIDAPSELMRAADIALCRAKDIGGNTIVHFAPSMDVETSARLTLETELQQALARDELCLHYQPVVEVAGERVREVEALVRWAHPHRGLLPPDDFVPLAEETDLIIPIGRWVLREACRQLAAWQTNGLVPDTMSVAVNVSARQFRHPSLTDDVTQAVHDAGIDPRRLTIEVTESAAMGDEATIHATMQRLKAVGVRLVLDDFGRGYSNLSALRRYPIDTLKIDQSLVARIADAPNDAAIVQAAVAVARALGLGVTAEGIETGEQASLLRAMGCDRVQGYFYSTPLPPERLAAYLASTS